MQIKMTKHSHKLRGELEVVCARRKVLLKINIKYLPARLGFYRFRKHFLKFRPRSRSTARGQHGSSEMAQKDIRGALLYHILFSNKASFGTVVKWRKKTSEELCYITFFFPIKLHLGQSDNVMAYEEFYWKFPNQSVSDTHYVIKHGRSTGPLGKEETSQRHKMTGQCIRNDLFIGC